MIAALHAPHFPLQAILRTRDELLDEPVGVIEHESLSGGMPINHLSEAAAREGVRVGMTVAQARSLLHALKVMPRHPTLEQAALAALADVASSFSPRHQIGGEEDLGWAYVDVAGLERLIGSVPDILRAIRSATESARLEVRAAVGRTKTLARLLVVGGGDLDHIVEDRAAETRFVSELPLLALEPTTPLLTMLHRFGLRTARDLLALEPKHVADKLGPEGTALYRRARGDDEQMGLVPQPVRSEFVEHTHLDYGVDNLEALGFVLRGVLDRLMARLGLAGFVAGDLRIELEYAGLGGCQRDVVIGAPTRDVRALLSLCRMHIAKYPPEQPVSVVAIHATPESQRHRQLDLFDPAGPAPEKLAVTVARLSALCGEDRVGSPKPNDSYVDDDFEVSSFAPPDFEGPGEGKAPTLPAATLRRFRPARDVEVLCYAGEPRRLEGAGLGGRIVSWNGPFRRAHNWWQDTDSAETEMYDVQLADGVYYRVLFDKVQRAWRVLGWYD